MKPPSDVRVASVFRNGRNQAIRLPRDMELDADQVLIERHGDVLTIRPRPRDWDHYFATCPSFVPYGVGSHPCAVGIVAAMLTAAEERRAQQAEHESHGEEAGPVVAASEREERPGLPGEGLVLVGGEGGERASRHRPLLRI
jgi:virulence-associated protein VagC